MLLATGPLTEFLQFIQVFFWITIPFLLIGILATTMMHYRKKKKRTRVDDEDLPEILPLPTNTAQYSPVPAEYVMTASLKQIREFRKRLSFSNARYNVLKKDYEMLGEKYNALLSSDFQSNETTENMENNEPTQINEQEYLRDVVREKKRQIEFLQQQLEQRIRENHELQHRFAELSTDFMVSKSGSEELSGQLEAYKLELQAKQEKKEQLLLTVEQLENQNAVLAKEQESFKEHIGCLEAIVAELRSGIGALETQLAGKEEIILGYNSQIAEYETRMERLNARLDANRKILLKVQTELNLAMETGLELNSPVILMKAVGGGQ